MASNNALLGRRAARAGRAPRLLAASLAVLALAARAAHAARKLAREKVRSGVLRLAPALRGGHLKQINVVPAKVKLIFFLFY